MQHEHHRVPVTALAFPSRNIMVTGEGNYLNAYSRVSGKQLAKVQVFDGQAIHGIKFDGKANSTGLIWGGSLFRRFHFCEQGDAGCEINLDYLQSTGDWILDSSFSSLGTQARPVAVLVTAHNALWTTHFEGDNDTAGEDPRPSHKEQVVAGSNCILYSAHITWLSASSCLVASGTAFGDIVLWSANFMNHDGRLSAQSQTHYTFSAHHGSIFGVQLSSSLKLSGTAEYVRVLASCSDDRNIKLWDITNLEVDSPTLMQIQRDTGFGLKQDETGIAPRCLAKVMGHISRIWHVRFIRSHHVAPALESILSFGEDASMIQWTLKPATKDVELPYELMKAECTIAHSGKNIWAVAQDWSNALATGGADGAIALHHAHPSHNKSTEIPRTVLDHCADGDTFRTYRFVAPNVLLSTTDKGRIVLLDTSTLQGATVKPIAGPLSGLRGYSVVESIEHVAFIGGTDGCVYSYSRNQDKLVTVTELGKKIAGLFTSRYQSNGVALLVTGQGDPAATLLLFSKDVERPATGECKLALPPGFVVTSFALLDSKDTCYAILGSRNGSIAISGIEMAGTFAHTRPATVCSLVYGKEAVTSLHSVTSESCDVERNDWIFSCGRDGTFAVHRISSSSGTMEIHLVHQLALPFGPNVEGLDVSSDGEVRILGFRSKHFVVYDINAQRETMSVECGGAHRNWTFQPDEDGGTFTWTKASKVYKITQSHMSHELINAGGHGREIKAVASCPGSTKQQIFATGAEDTNIKLFKLVDGGFICLQTLRKHNTGIQHLQWSRDGQYLFSSGGFEEFFVWKINFDVPYLNVGVVCESMHPRCGTSDLRISGFDVQIIENAGSTITMAYSDSTVKIWHYVAKTWQQLVTADYLTACLTHVLPDHRYDPGLVTAATDGHIVHWQLQNNQKQVLTWVGRHRVHQNAIHAAISHSLPDGSTLIVTGGDDNAIGFTRVAVEINTLLISDAHAAAVTGLTIIPSSRSVSNFRLASSGVDQRVKIWEVEFDYDLPGVKGINVRRVQDVFTAVADVSGLEVCRLEDGGLGLLICGVGMDVWRLST